MRPSRVAKAKSSHRYLSPLRLIWLVRCLLNAEVKKVNVRRTVAVATQSVQQFLGWAIRRAAVAGGHDAAHAVAAIGAGADRRRRLYSLWPGSKKGIISEGVGVPDINNSVGWPTFGVFDFTGTATSLLRRRRRHPCGRDPRPAARPATYSGPSMVRRVPVSRCAAASMASWRRSKCSSPSPAASSAASDARPARAK